MIAAHAHRRTPVAVLALVIVLIAALGVRLYGLNWDEGQDLHPDELFVAKIVLVDRIRLDWPPDLGRLLDPATSGLNPRSVDPGSGEFREFAYGALPLLVTDGIAGLLSLVSETDWNGPDRVYVVGRVLSALFDTVTVGLVFLLGVRLAGPAVGLFAAVIAALAPMSIQLAHFFTTDSWLTTFVALCLLLSIRAADRATISAAAAAGASAGLAMATKGSAFALTLVVGLAVLLPFWQWRGWRGPFPVTAPRSLCWRWLASGLAAVAGFGLFEPFALVRPDVYLRSLQTQADIVSGAFDVPFTRVFATASPLHAFREWFLWGFGPVGATLSIAGLVLLLRRARSSRPIFVVVAWFLIYAGIIVTSEVQFLRYLAPLTPVMAVAAGFALNRVRVCLVSRRSILLPEVATGVAMVAVGLWTAVFVGVYSGEHPRLAASRWMYATLSPGSTVTAEYWDDALPKDFGVALGSQPFGIASLTVDLYADRPPEDVVSSLYGVLRRADAIALSSNRVEASVLANPWRYPVQGRFYELLADEALGFRLSGTWERPPHLGPLTIDDRDADESFINYDHPRVRVYVRDEPIDRADFESLMAWAVERPWQPARYPVGQSLLIDGPVGALPVVGDARWSAPITESTGGAVGVWLVLLVVLQVVGLPLARLLLGRFVDGGWAFARLITLIVAGYLVWIAASVEIIAFTAVWCAAAIVVLAIVAWIAARRSVSPARTSIGVSAEAVWSEAVFWVIFGVFLGLRFFNPDSWHPLWGGEKPMEFAHLNAILRSAHFPPYDPWFADGYLNYYYYGTYLVAFLLKLTGIPSEIGFNLAQPTVIALLASGAFSLGATLGRGLARRSAILAGAAASVLMVLVGNLTSVHQFIQRAIHGVPLHLGSFVDWTWNGSRAIEGAITEFPFFTGLYADLHAHVVALPITVFGIALAYALVLEPERLIPFDASTTVYRIVGLALVLGTLSATNAWDVPVYSLLAVAAIWMTTRLETCWRWRLASFVSGALGLAVGAYALFLPFHAHFVALFGSVAPVTDPTPFGEWALHIGTLAAICGLTLTVLLIPRKLPVAFAWLRPEVLLVAVAALLTAATVLDSQGGGIDLFPVGMVVILGAVLLAVGLVATRRGDFVDRLPVVAGVLLSAAALAGGRLVLALAIAGLTAAISGWLGGRTPSVRYWCLLVAAAMGVSAGVELVVVADDLIETSAYRMNTVFKFYNQVWVLLAIAGGTGIAAMLAAARLPTPRHSTRVSFVPPGTVRPGRELRLAEISASPAEGGAGGARRRWAIVGVALSIVAVVASFAYPLLATGPRLAQRFADPPVLGTLNALAWMDSATLATEGGMIDRLTFDGDRAVIDWFNREVEGSPVIAEASIGPYRCNGSRISIATGLPTIIGWDRHESQQRPVSDLPGRVADVARLYKSPNAGEKEQLLRRYNVEYVVVGDLERAYPIANNECGGTGSEEGIAAFEAMVGETLQVAFRRDDTVVYRVLPVRDGSAG